MSYCDECMQPCENVTTCAKGSVPKSLSELSLQLLLADMAATIAAGVIIKEGTNNSDIIAGVSISVAVEILERLGISSS